MKNRVYLMIILIFLAIVSFAIITKSDNNEFDKEEILKIGEEKYLQFLWMVDGAFNNERMNDEYEVNGKKMDENNKVFTCKYKKNSNTCMANNFEEEFRKLFASRILYDNVYGDNLTFSWIKYEKGKYYFTNPNNCNTKRMSLIHNLEIKSVDGEKIVFNASFMGNRVTLKREFILIKEDNIWKISKAFYRDLCEMDYYIE